MNRWLASWCFAAFWLLSTEIFVPSAGGWVVPALFLLGGVALTAFRARDTNDLVRGRLILGTAVVALSFAVPWPYAVVWATAGIGFSLGDLRQGGPRRLAKAMVDSSVSLACGLLVVAAFFLWGADWHELPSLSAPFAFLLERLGIHASVVAGRLVVVQPDRIVDATPTVEALGILPLALLVAGGLPGWFRRPGLTTRAAWLVVSVVGFLVIHGCAALVTAATASTSRAVWSPGVMVASALPLAFALALVPDGNPGSLPVAARMPTKVSWILAAAGGWMLLWLGANAPLAGIPKQGRILIDEHHSRWERTDAPVDQSDYGSESTYNYSAMKDVLADYYVVATNGDDLTDESLAKCDVLMVKTPTEPYTQAEIAAIERFVRTGGGLLLVGDHTDVFGTSSHLNPIGARFGMRFAFDATHDVTTGGLSLYESPRVTPHPIVLHLPPFLFATSCSLERWADARAVQVGYGLGAFPGDYSQPSFFAEHTPRYFFPCGLFNQCLAAEHGRGRVVAFSDSTVWSTFFMQLTGKRELLLGMMDWLNRRDAATWLATLLLVAGASIVAISFLMGLRSRASDTWFAVGVVASCVGLGLAIPARDAWARAGYPAPTPHRHRPTVGFVTDGMNFHLPIRRLVDPLHETYLTFFNWVHRVGLVPECHDRSRDAERECEAVVLLRPIEAPSEAEVESLRAYVRRGGAVLVLLDDEYAERQRPLASLAGMSIVQGTSKIGSAARSRPPIKGNLSAKDREGRPPVRARWRVRGGDALLVDETGESLLSSASIGEGRLVVGTIASVFGDGEMGHETKSPSEREKELYALEFELMRFLLPHAAK